MVEDSTEGRPGRSAAARQAWRWFHPHAARFAVGVLCLLGTNAVALLLPRLLNTGVEDLARGAGVQVLLATALWMVGAAVLLAGTRVLSRIYLFNVGRDIEYQLRRALYAALCRQPLAYHQTHPVGDLMTRATGDLANVRSLFGFAALNVINTAVVYAGNLPLLALLDWRLTLLALLPFPVVLGAVRVVTRAVFVAAQRNQEDVAVLTSRLHQHLGGVPVVRAFAQQDAEVARFGLLNQQAHRSAVRVSVVRNLLGPITGLMGAGSAAVALWLGAGRVVAGAMTVGDLMEFNARLAALTGPTLALGWTLAVWQRGVASLGRVHEVLDAEPLLRDPPEPCQPTVRAGTVALDHVCVEHTTSGPDGPVTRRVLNNVQWSIPPGAFVGLVGAAGSGKSTLLLLLARVMDVNAGRVLVDGVDVKDRTLAELRQDVAVVPQEALLFDTTVLENLRMGCPEADVGRVMAVANVVGLTRDIAALPAGLDTVVGERGVMLSGGQRQRVALGRALLCAPRVLVLDDTVAALDGPTLQHVMAGVLALSNHPTVVLATHRLHALKHAQDILVLVDGQVAEHGAHDQLLALGGHYATQWGQQAAPAAEDHA